jgi:hypothetical protein
MIDWAVAIRGELSVKGVDRLRYAIDMKTIVKPSAALLAKSLAAYWITTQIT